MQINQNKTVENLNAFQRFVENWKTYEQILKSQTATYLATLSKIQNCSGKYSK